MISQCHQNRDASIGDSRTRYIAWARLVANLGYSVGIHAAMGSVPGRGERVNDFGGVTAGHEPSRAINAGVPLLGRLLRGHILIFLGLVSLVPLCEDIALTRGRLTHLGQLLLQLFG